MSSRMTAVRRVTVALCAAELPASLIHLVLDAARDGEAPALRAVFIEDADLLNAVALPFTAEFCTLTNRARPIDRAVLEARMLSEAQACAREVARLAAAVGTTCEFEVVRARRAAVIGEHLAAADLLLIARPRAAHGRSAVVRAIVDGEPGGGNCRALAAHIADSVGAPLELYALAHAANPGTRPVADRAAARALLATPGARLVLMTNDVMQRLELTPHELDELCAAPVVVVR